MASSIGISTLLAVGLPLLALAGAVFLYRRVDIDVLMPDIEPDQLAAITIGVAATYLGVLLALGLAWFGTGIRTPLLAIGFGLLGTALGARFPATATTRDLIEGAIGGLLAYAASNILIVVTTTATTTTNAVVATIFVVLAVLPAVLIIPLGHADVRSPRIGVALRAMIIGSPLLLAVIDVASSSAGPAPGLSALLGSYLLVVAILGVVLYWVGMELAVGNP